MLLGGASRTLATGSRADGRIHRGRCSRPRTLCRFRSGSRARRRGEPQPRSFQHARGNIQRPRQSQTHEAQLRAFFGERRPRGLERQLLAHNAAATDQVIWTCLRTRSASKMLQASATSTAAAAMEPVATPAVPATGLENSELAAPVSALASTCSDARCSATGGATTEAAVRTATYPVTPTAEAPEAHTEEKELGRIRDHRR